MKHALIAVGTLAVVALLVPSVQAQSRGGARGKVFDEEEAPVADAKVLIEFTDGARPPFEVQTNDKGEYIQIGLPAGGRGRQTVFGGSCRDHRRWGMVL